MVIGTLSAITRAVCAEPRFRRIVSAWSRLEANYSSHRAALALGTLLANASYGRLCRRL